MAVSVRKFGELDGQDVTAYTLDSLAGIQVTAIDYGCIITEVLVPDRSGQMENVVLGFQSLDEYVKDSPFFGAVTGRYAGRIKDGQFRLDGETYTLAQNENGHHLHGGNFGFDKVLWKAHIEEGAGETSIVFSRRSPDGEEGYPGNLEINVSYTLKDNGDFVIGYDAVSDKKTLLNVTNHSYFNLSGNAKRDILGHQLTMKADRFAELGEGLIPTGTLLDTAGTAFDFRGGRTIRDGAESSHEQNRLAGNGYDHPFLLSENRNREITLHDPESGRLLTVETDEPAVILYTGNQLPSHLTVSGGVKARSYLGLCLETQKIPDDIHHPEFPSSVLEKDVPYHSETLWKFSIKE